MPADNTYIEKELLLQVAEGNETAFRTLFDRHRDTIYSIAWRLTKENSAAEDVVQEVFIKLWVHKEKLPEINSLSAYINTLTRNHIFTQMRKLATEEAYLRELIATEKLSATPDAVLYNELKKVLGEAVAQLSPQQKKVYQLGKMEGKKYEEIADLLHISRETVKNHMSDALKSIKSFLLKHEGLLTWLVLMITAARN